MIQPHRTRTLLLVWMIAGLLAACAGGAPTPVALNANPTAIPTALPSATVTPRPTATSNNTPTASTPIPSATATLAPVRQTSGWTVYSNPDFIRGLVVHGRQLWAATLGGVVAWDLDTQKPTLYTTRDGLAEIQGNAVAYCSMPQERILVAHTSGVLSAYDLTLKRWSRIPITFKDGSSLNGVQTLFCDSANQRLIVGSKDGLGILEMSTGSWRHIGPAEGLKVDLIRSIGVVGQSIWVAAGEKAAFMIMGKTVFPFDSAAGFPTGSVHDLAVAPDMSIWFGYSTGLVHYHDKKWNSFGALSSSGIPFLSVDYVVVGPDKHIWIASSGEGVCPFNPATLFCSTVYPSTGSSLITDLAVGDDGVAYAGTEGGGVLVLASDKVQHLVYSKGLLMSNDVLDMAQDHDGKMWVATDRGVNSFDPGNSTDPWEVMTPRRNQLIFSRVSGILPTADGMWFFYDNETQATFYNGTTWAQLDTFKGLSGPVLDSLIDQRGYAWFSTPKGINVWDGSVMRAYAPLDDVPGNVFHALLEKDGGIWVGSDRGLLRYQRYQWQVILPGIQVNAIAPDVDGGLLLGTDQGLIRFDGSQSFTWIINLGQEIIIKQKVTSIAQDRSGNLWIGTWGNGLFHYDGTGWEQFNTATGLPANNIRKIFTDRQGTVWIAAVTGDGGGALVHYVP